MSGGMRVKADHTDSWASYTVFTHKAVRVRPVGIVFGDQRNGHCDLLYVVNRTLNLKETEGTAVLQEGPVKNSDGHIYWWSKINSNFIVS